MSERGFDIVRSNHPICPIMFYDAGKALDFANRMLQKGGHVIAFAFPVVPQGKARIRTQISAAHSEDDLLQAMDAFSAVKQDMGL